MPDARPIIDFGIEERIAEMIRKEENRSPEEKEQILFKRAADARREHLLKIDGLIKDSSVPKRHLQLSKFDRAGEWARVESNIKSQLRKGFLIALVGLRGSGKTQLAVEIIRASAELDYTRSRYCTAMEFFIEIKAGYKHDGEAEKIILNEFSVPPLLVIDELGQRSENDWENRLLYELLNRRYNDMKDTLLISNQDLAQLEMALGPSLVSRMRETGGVIECNWESYRQ